ncbi:hypothetical protein [Saccharothrix xinjiangensis]|uniref:Uncharacterized protein n=1 Tax=Saccharothrix xinjiangensis TaxID=204798 RepID=A0ABV9Y0M4_9PSEU
MTAAAPPRGTTTTDYAAHLDAAHEAAAPNAVVVGPGGYAFATPERLAADPLWLSGTTGHALRPAAVLPVANRVAAEFGVACARLADPEPGRVVGARTERLRHHLLRAHTRLLAHVVDLTVADLGGRTAAGSPLLGRQLVQAGIADAVLLVEETGGLLDAGVDHDAHPAAFARLVRGGRALLRLLGAASFLTDGPGGAVLTAEQVGTLYLAVRHD